MMLFLVTKIVLLFTLIFVHANKKSLEQQVSIPTQHKSNLSLINHVKIELKFESYECTSVLVVVVIIF